MNLTELRKLAEDATRGPWGYRANPVRNDGWFAFGPCGPIGEADAKFIAAANPDTMLALVADLEAARAALIWYADPSEYSGCISLGVGSVMAKRAKSALAAQKVPLE